MLALDYVYRTLYLDIIQVDPDVMHVFNVMCASEADGASS